MGKYLQGQYEERDLAKALAKVPGLIDEETEKLSDKFHDLELSHNRQEKLLKEVDVLLRTFWNLISSSEKYVIFKDFYCNHSFLSSAESLHIRIKRELVNPLYRCRERKKGGKK